MRDKPSFLFDQAITHFFKTDGLSVDRAIQQHSDWIVDDIFSAESKSAIRDEALRQFFHHLEEILSEHSSNDVEVEKRLRDLWFTCVRVELEDYRMALDTNTSDHFRSKLKRRVFFTLKTWTLPFVAGLAPLLATILYIEFIVFLFPKDQTIAAQGVALTPFITTWGTLFYVLLFAKWRANSPVWLLTAYSILTLLILKLAPDVWFAAPFAQITTPSLVWIVTTFIGVPALVAVILPLCWLIASPIALHGWLFRFSAKRAFGWF